MLGRRPKTAPPPSVAEPAYSDGWDVPARFNFTRDVIEPLARQHSRAALTFVDREGIVDRRTFREISGDAARWAHLMRTRLDRGDRVLFAMGKTPAWLSAMLGALKGGLIAVPCSETLRARDLAFRVRHSGAGLVIADRSLELEIGEMLEQLQTAVPVVYLDDARTELSGYVGEAPTEDTTSAERALLLYTSGTTGEPRGVVHTHAYTWAMRAQADHWLAVRGDDVVWCTAETGWAKSVWNVLLGPWSHGAEVVLHDGDFDPQERLELLERLGVTVLCQTPTEYRKLANLDSFARTRLPRLRHAVSTGEPLNPDVIGRFEAVHGITVYDGYGQTETSLLVANAPGMEVRPGSMGLPTPGHEVEVVDELGIACEPGAEGDIALRGRPPTLFAGYWEAREDTDAAFRGDWYRTGDRAIRDEDGYLWFVGRTDDVIVSSSYRIGPFEVESTLLEHAAVAETAVVAAPDADSGEIVKAFVVLRPGFDPTSDLVAELQEHVKTIIAPYKHPRQIAFVDELPKTTSGKIRRSVLRSQPETGFPRPLSLVIPLPVDESERARAEDEAAAEARREAREAARRAAAEAARKAVERAALRGAAFITPRREIEAVEPTVEPAVGLAPSGAVEPVRRDGVSKKAPSEVVADAALVADGPELDHAGAALHAADEAARRQAEAARAEAAAARAAEEAARREAEEAARRAAVEAARREAEEAARREAEAARAEAEASRAAEETARREAEEAARREAEAARREAEAARAEAEAARAAEEAARRAAEEAARRAAEEAARREAEEAARREAEAARLEAEAAAQRAAEEAARREAEAAAQREAEEAARRDAEAAARRAAEEAALREAEAAARREAEAAAQRAAEEAARREAEAAAQREAEEAARREAEAAAQLAAAEAAARREAEAAAQREAEEAARRAAEAAAQREAEEAARREAEAAAQREAEEAARREAEAAAQREAEEAARREAEAAAEAVVEAETVPADDPAVAAVGVLELSDARLDEAQPDETEQHLGRRERKAAEKRRKQEERLRAKAEAERRKRDEAEAKERAKAEAEQRKRDEAEAKERAKAEAEQRKRDEIEAKERAKAEAEQRKRDEIEAKERAKAEAEQRKRDEAAARAAEKERAAEERRRQRELAKQAKGRGLGLGRLFRDDDEPEEEDDDGPVTPIENIVERLEQYSRPKAPAAPVANRGGDAQEPPEAAQEPSD